MTTSIASITADGTQSNGSSTLAGSASTSAVSVLSDDGRYVVFQSAATNLAGTDTNGRTDIFRKDLITGEIVRVTESDAGVQADFGSSDPSISADGRYVVFQSVATNLAGTDTNDASDIFRKDLDTGEIVRVTDAAGVQSDRESFNASISADGRYVVFQSLATNLAGTDTNGRTDIFRKDLDTGEIVRISDTETGALANGGSTNASMSADGRYVVFHSDATNLTGTDANGAAADIFRRDLTTGELVRVSEVAGLQGDGQSVNASVSADGRYVVFESAATNLAGTDTNGATDIFRKDLSTGEIVRVTDAAGGDQANGASTTASISNDGRYVAFRSAATNLVNEDSNGATDVFVKDMVTGAIVRLSNADGGSAAGNGTSVTPSISGDGSRVAYASSASNLVAGDGNGLSDVFVSSVCFAAGSAIRVMRAGVARDVAVEALAVGDLAVTASGGRRPIRWIGHRSLVCHGRTDAMPVRIAAHAFGEGRPSRDLFVSPAHAIAVDVLGEVLIPAIRLVNGTTITQVETETVTYWHVELDSHDILLAENLPAESYLDCGNRGFFANADATDLAALPDARPEEALPFCRPFHESGPLVELVRARLADRAEALGWRRVDEVFAGLHLVADGRTIRPDTDGLTARFVLPAEAQDVRLVSDTSVPAHLVPGSTDDRRLGIPLAALSIDDGLTGPRAIALDDVRLDDGFYAVDDGMRWSDGSAVLPADLWAGCRGTVFVRVTLTGPALPRWAAPDTAAGRVRGSAARCRV